MRTQLTIARPLRRAARLLALAGLLLTSAGACDGGGDGGEAELLTTSGLYAVEWAPQPAPIPLNEHFDLTVRVSDAADGTMLPDATVRVDAGMPQHGHGMNVAPVVTSHGDGSFTVEGLLFHMPGLWELTIEVTRDGVVDAVVVPITLEV